MGSPRIYSKKSFQTVLPRGQEITGYVPVVSKMCVALLVKEEVTEGNSKMRRT